MIYRDAKDLAQRLAKQIEPGCLRLEIVGSTKRGDRAECHDIEFLVIANRKTPRPEFGQKVIHLTMLDKVLHELCLNGVLKFVKGREKYKKFEILEAKTVNAFALELWIVNEHTWGIQNVIRTGPALFSHRFVTNKSMSFYDAPLARRFTGLLPDQYTYVKGETKIMHRETALSLPEEADALAVLGLGWIEPKDRRAITLRR